MTVETVHMLRKSFQRLEEHGHVPALVFYRRLFELDPALKPLFKNDIESQARKLSDMLAALLRLLSHPEELKRTLEELGERHVAYGVQESHYATVGTAFLDMLSEVLAREFTPELKSAWAALLGAVSATMIAGANRAAH